MLQELLVEGQLHSSGSQRCHSSYHLDAVTLILRVLAMYSFDKRVMFPLLLTALIALSVAAVGTFPPYPKYLFI